MIKRIFMLLFLTVSLGLSAQGLVTGTIVDKDNGETLPGASVIISGTQKGVITDIDGTFSIELSSASADIEISFMGYQNKLIEVNVSEKLNLGEIILESNQLILGSVEVIASIAKDRETPVAISSIKPRLIEEKLGSQEYPEILKSTPSVYATKQGGGYGDSRINMRGFDSNNIGILVNGVPVNDMETGKVYWSNWAGLSDVTRLMQVQRGLGASKIAVPSVGGTINIITNSVDAERGGSIGAWLGNDGYFKQSFSVSTGLNENGFAISLSGGHVSGNGYVQGTNFEGYNYFINISKRLNDNHNLSFTAFGAPQTHNQRSTQHTIQQYRDSRFDARWNSDLGYRNGEVYTGGYNYYHKPQLSLNHLWQIDNSSKLASSFYVSISSGGGRAVEGENDSWLEFDYQTGKPKGDTKLTPEGYLDFEAVIAANAANAAEGESAGAVITNSTNSHQWYGLLSTYEKEMSQLKITAGIDGRYYKAQHYKKIEDLLGADFVYDYSDINQSSPRKVVGDKVAYNNPGEVLYSGLFGQAEYATLDWSAFVSASVANNFYQRTDYFNYSGDEQKAGWQNFWTWTTKGGANYNLNENHNIFVNSGYILRAPYFKNAYVGYTNEENKNALSEKIITGELGYGYQTPTVNVKSNLYYTQWNDRGLVKTFGDQVANIPGVNATHYGFELETEFRPTKELNIKGMFSIGNWYYTDDVYFDLYDDNQNLIDSYSAYLKDVHVGNSAQTTAALGVTYELLPKFKIGMDFNYYGRNYADFDPTNRTTEEDKVDAWQLPDFITADVNLNYRFKIGDLDAIMYANVNNLFNTEYVADATDGDEHDVQTALVYYGFGTTWTGGLKIKF